MPRPIYTRATVSPQQADWDATLESSQQDQDNFIINNPFPPAIFTVASGGSQLPAAGTWLQCIAMVSDPASGKSPLVYSDGTNWRYVGDNTIAL